MGGRLADQQMTSESQAQPAGKVFAGTPDYLAPESILGLGQDSSVDWVSNFTYLVLITEYFSFHKWSLGVMLYEFLYGVPPFNAPTPQEVFENILSRSIDWHEDDLDVSSDARDLMDRLMCSNIETRLGHNGAEEIKAHPFFSDIDWKALGNIEPSFIPKPSDAEDTEYFDDRGAATKKLSDTEYVNDDASSLSGGGVVLVIENSEPLSASDSSPILSASKATDSSVALNVIDRNSSHSRRTSISNRSPSVSSNTVQEEEEHSTFESEQTKIIEGHEDDKDGTNGTSVEDDVLDIKNEMSNDFGEFVYKNLSALEKANNDLVKKLRSDLADSSRSHSRTSSDASSESLSHRSKRFSINNNSNTSSYPISPDSDFNTLNGKALANSLSTTNPTNSANLSSPSSLPPPSPHPSNQSLPLKQKHQRLIETSQNSRRNSLPSRLRSHSLNSHSSAVKFSILPASSSVSSTVNNFSTANPHYAHASLSPTSNNVNLRDDSYNGVNDANSPSSAVTSPTSAVTSPSSTILDPSTYLLNAKLHLHQHRHQLVRSQSLGNAVSVLTNQSSMHHQNSPSAIFATSPASPHSRDDGDNIIPSTSSRSSSTPSSSASTSHSSNLSMGHGGATLCVPNEQRLRRFSAGAATTSIARNLGMVGPTSASASALVSDAKSNQIRQSFENNDRADVSSPPFSPLSSSYIPPNSKQSEYDHRIMTPPIYNKHIQYNTLVSSSSFSSTTSSSSSSSQYSNIENISLAGYYQQHLNRPLSVLVADDNPVACKILETMLSRLMCDVVAVRNGAEALRCAMGDVRFDVIFMDVRMPISKLFTFYVPRL